MDCGIFADYTLIAGSAFILGLLLVPAAIKIAFKYGIVDRPVTKLKKHKKPVAYLGGVAIYLAFLLPVIGAKFMMHGTIKGVIGITAGATIIMIMGLIDDIKNLGPYTKLGVELIVALVLIKVNMNIKFMDNNIFNWALTILWVIGITNAMNIIDIMDGLAGGVALVASAAFFTVALIAGRMNDMIPAAALFGSLCAFLIFNRQPARVYMGDTGSLFLGFMMASLALNESYTVKNHVAVLSPLLILGVPIFDTFLVMAVRIGKGLLPLYGSDDHLAQRLVMIGLSKQKAVIFLVMLTFVLSIVAVISTFLDTAGAVVLYLFVGIAALLFAMLVMSVDMKHYHIKHRQK